MALIVCPGCGKQISDKALSCPDCGFLLKNEKEEKSTVCEECGAEIADGVTACPNCGCPIIENSHDESPQKVEVTKVAVNKKKVIRIVVIVVIAVAVILGGAFGVKYYLNQKKEAELEQQENDYFSNLKLAVTSMLSGSSDAESCGGLIHDVWSNSIYEKDDKKTNKYCKKEGYSTIYNDFNTSLANLFADSSFSSKIDSLKENQDMVKELMKKLQNPPEKYSEAYDSLKEYYDVYLTFTNLATNPTGSLQSYTSDFNDADTKVLKCYEAMQIYIE